MSGSNRRPPACKAGALPAELIPHLSNRCLLCRILVGLDGLEPSTPALSRRCSNQLSYRPAYSQIFYWCCFDLTTDKCECLQNWIFSRKEVIQPHLPIRLPCYDFTPVMNTTVVSVLPKVRLPTSGKTHSHGVTGGVYKARERIHRDMLIRDY